MSTTQQHEKIKGYRTLNDAEISLMNQGKVLAEHVGKYLDILKTTPGIDQRWVAIAGTSLQQGFMAAARSVAQPTTF